MDTEIHILVASVGVCTYTALISAGANADE
jgi:hypothetical protein